jgi:2-polyprenyl-3-methyl-5-hydroxy-6-metoxy-1,4-benzoquinol methylase
MKITSDVVSAPFFQADGRGPAALSDWKQHSGKMALQPTEFLVPLLHIGDIDRAKEFAFMRRELAIDVDRFSRRLAALATWTYFVSSNGVDNRAQGSYNDSTIDFHRFRNGLITDTVKRIIGPGLEDLSLLDIGCNSGFFTLEGAAAGFGRAVGVDLREENIEQARFLRSAFDIRNSEFSIQNVKHLEASGDRFDVVYNLGLMYHLSTPFEVLRTCRALTRRFCVIDTITHKEPFSGYHVALKDNSVTIEGDLAFELQPTYRGIIDTIKAAGFASVVEIVSDNPEGIELYQDSTRRCFLAFVDEKPRELSALGLVA